jgi:hypothetical protein
MSVYTTSTSGIFVGWENTGNLGVISRGENSELFVKIAISTSTVDVKYQLTGGNLPESLVLNHDGTISGVVPTQSWVSSSTTTSTFSVEAIDNHRNMLIAGEFSITVKQTTSTEFTNLYFKPLLIKFKRDEFSNFINNDNIFNPELIYRPFDKSFGIQRDLKLVLEFGVKKLTLLDYANMLTNNFQKRKFIIGSVKSAVAKNSDGTTRHHIVYLDIIDTNINSSGNSIPNAFLFNGVTYYPSSLVNMKTRIANSATITHELNPPFTTTIQPGAAIATGYIAFIPLCFSLPDKNSKLIRNINNNGFDFSKINYDIDRIYINSSQGNDGAKYLLLNRNTGIV